MDVAFVEQEARRIFTIAIYAVSFSCKDVASCMKNKPKLFQ
jgi:hypothetical protein